MKHYHDTNHHHHHSTGDARQVGEGGEYTEGS
jgi:hypothetical protein